MAEVNLLRRYADLVVRVGANVGEGQDVVIGGYVEHAPFVRALAAAAYEAGARYVASRYADQYVKRELIVHGSDELLEWSPPWQLEQLEYFAGVGGAETTIAGDPNPDVFADLDGARVGKARPRELSQRSLELVFEERRMNWTIAAYPTERWAEKVFGQPDVERLWENVAKAVRLDEPDPVAAWRTHVEHLVARATLLNERLFDALHFRGPGTDLTIGLTRAYRWGAAQLETADGRRHVPNMPTEEVFTAPDARRADGVVRSTRPLGAAGGLIVEGLELRFEGGRVVEVKADKGEDVVRAQLDTDEGARRLGEVALVDGSSRVGQLGVTFFDTLRRERDLPHRVWRRARLHPQPRRRAARGRGQLFDRPHRHDRRAGSRGGRSRGRRGGRRADPSRRRVGAHVEKRLAPSQFRPETGADESRLERYRRCRGGG
ncbi:aminopeptidase [soil metagenome]